ncbi:hypothetical protein [Fredinandcohnia sp. 179-A 10B2 NHS]
MKQPSQETLNKILFFFTETSVPRILEEERKLKAGEISETLCEAKSI